jgi:Putative lipoprotein LpqV
MAVAAGTLVAAGLVMAACSAKPPAPPQTSTTTAQAAAPTAPVQVGISPNGVTTSLSAPASSTEDEYYQACHWARLWMSGQPGDPHAQIEPYLAMVQHSTNGENGTWQTPWAQLSPERQSAVIVAATAAAEGGCD